jgi:hypothetical protein
MNYKIVIGIVVVVIIVVLAVIFLLPKKDQQPKITIRETNPKELELVYSINAGIPFRWEYEIEDESIVQFVESYVRRDDNVGAIAGAEVERGYVFKGLKPGTTTITFKYLEFTTGEVTTEKKHTVVVEDNLDIKEVK